MKDFAQERTERPGFRWNVSVAKGRLSGFALLLPLAGLLATMALTSRPAPLAAAPQEETLDPRVQDVRFAPWWRVQLHQAYGAVLREQACLGAGQTPAQVSSHRRVLARSVDDYNRLARQAPPGIFHDADLPRHLTGSDAFFGPTRPPRP